VELVCGKQSAHRSVRLTALNDCIVHCGASPRVILLRVKINNDWLTDYLGDGIIISTPTGSTAYSLATGGPIVNPLLPVFIISPICPHTLSQRPLIVSSADKLSIEILEYKSNKDIVFSVDSQENFVVNPSDKITIKKSKYILKLITHPEKSYYKILREKLHWGCGRDE
ncbi:MAG: NAD(+)/NADH kinase, partial [Elusimicrobiota bacterium]|nr:NAD(+)/NADH kinase [Elusimicrobiota bacterium]